MTVNNKESSNLKAQPEHRFKPGQSGNPSGRPAGSPNKTTALLKDAILLAAKRAGGGSDDGMANYLEQQAKDNPGPFMSLLGKVLPMQVTGEGDGALKIIIERYSDTENA